MASAQLTRNYPRDVDVNGNTVQLRLMGAGDHQAMLEFARSLKEEDLLFLRMDIADPNVIQKWIDAVQTGLRVTVLAESGGQIMGYGSLNRRELAWSRHLGEIRIIVHPDHRRKKLGVRLASEVFDLARDLGLVKIVAQMTTDQPGARRMFEQLGFKPEALLTDWVIDRRDRTRDLVVMSYDVSGITD